MRERRRTSACVAVALAVMLALRAVGCDGESQNATVAPGPAPCADKTGEAPFAGARHTLVGLELRRYLLHVPASYRADGKAPLVLAFHGLGATPEDMSTLSGLSNLANEKGFIVAYPQGRDDAEGKPSWFFPNESNDFEFVQKLIGEVENEYCVDTRRIYAVGHSNGASFTYDLACDKTELFAAFAALAGGPMPTGCSPSRPPAIAILQGERDQVVRPAQTEEAKNLFVQMEGCQSTVQLPDGCVRYAGCVDGSEVLWCLVPGMGHVAWPGGYADSGGPVDGNAEIWGFFEAHPVP